jgi:hypothetical protein
MRKRIIAPAPLDSQVAAGNQRWLDLESLASVEVTSEDKDFPIEGALLPAGEGGWRAAAPGTQTIRLHFDRPQKLNRIWLFFEEGQTNRTQEFVVRYSSDAAGALRDVVRQQWNFTAPDATREVEDYAVELSNVTTLELTIVPDISGGPARASLLKLRLA